MGVNEPLLVTFVGGATGPWSVERILPVTGESLETVAKVAVIEGLRSPVRARDASWVLRGATGPDRYTRPSERKALDSVSPPLGRAASTAAALIPVRKTEAWWALPPEERRAIFAERSHHIAASLPYLPRVARRLHHSRDLDEPFDFLTWFEFAPADAPIFDELLLLLRGTEEWTYVEREVEIRLRREALGSEVGRAVSARPSC